MERLELRSLVMLLLLLWFVPAELAASDLVPVFWPGAGVFGVVIVMFLMALAFSSLGVILWLLLPTKRD